MQPGVQKDVQQEGGALQKVEIKCVKHEQLKFRCM